MQSPDFLRKSVVSCLLFMWVFTWGVYLLESLGFAEDNLPEQVDQIIEDPLSVPVESPVNFSIKSPDVSSVATSAGLISAVLLPLTLHLLSGRLDPLDSFSSVLEHSLPLTGPQFFQRSLIYRI